MKNFGAEQLILVNPCSLQGAEKTAMHAADILEKAVITKTFADALTLVDTSIATTSETAGLLRNALNPFDVKNVRGNIGIVLGRESNGLTNEEIEICDFVVSISASEEYPVLNAASAGCIILYELFKSKRREPKPKKEVMRKERILEEFQKISDLIEKREHRKRIWRIVLKRVLSKAFLTDRETTVLLGFFRRIRTVLETILSQKR